jgi:hypothetical protein
MGTATAASSEQGRLSIRGQRPPMARDHLHALIQAQHHSSLIIQQSSHGLRHHQILFTKK